MKISLSNFKSKIDPVIVEREDGYFYQGLARELGKNLRGTMVSYSERKRGLQY